MNINVVTDMFTDRHRKLFVLDQFLGTENQPSSWFLQLVVKWTSFPEKAIRDVDSKSLFMQKSLS